MIYMLIGRSSVGKDTIYKRLLESKLVNFQRIVTYTTRPIREHEVDGVEYHFVSVSEMQRMQDAGKILELRCYNTVMGNWYYFTAKDDSIDIVRDNYLVIGTLQMYESFQENLGVGSVTPIFIDLDKGIILERALSREKLQASPNYEELCRRFIMDSDDFSQTYLEKAGIAKKFINDDLDKCVSEIISWVVENDIIKADKER